MSDSAEEIYKKLKDFYSYTKVMLGAKSLMTVDMMISMPRGAINQRMRDIDVLTLRIHEYIADPTIGEKLDICEQDMERNTDYWSKWDLANLRQMRKIYTSYSALPIDIFSKVVRYQNLGLHVQAKFIKDNDQDSMKAYLEDVVQTMREVAKRKQEAFETETLYEGLLKGYVDDISEKECDRLNDSILETVSKQNMTRLAPEKKPSWSIEPELSKRDMMLLGTLMLQDFDFDFNYGRLIVSQGQSYCGGTNLDARILVKCSDPPDFFVTLGDMLYQGGRGLYMQNIPQKWAEQPVGSLSVMPSVSAISLLLEHFIGSSFEFYEYLSSQIKTMPSAPGDSTYSAANMFKLKQELIDHHPPGTSTRNLKDLLLNILTTNIEKDLVSGKLDIDEIQERWMHDLKQTFDLEDIDKDDHQKLQQYWHVPIWFTGQYGAKMSQNISYVMAAQIYRSLQENIMDFDHVIQAGEFKVIKDWLNKNLFSHAHSLTFPELLKATTGTRDLDARLMHEIASGKAV